MFTQRSYPTRRFSTRKQKRTMALYRPKKPYMRRALPPAPEIKAWDWHEHAIPYVVGLDYVAGIPSTNIMTTGMTCLNCGVQEGTSFYERIGSKIVIKSISLKGWLQASTNTEMRKITRSMILYDRQPNGAYPGINDVLAINGIGPAERDIMTGLNMDNRSRFSILRDKILPTTNYGTKEQAIPICEYITGRWEVEYGSSTGLIGDIKTGAILWLLFTNDHQAADTFLMSYVSRIRYYD